MTAADEPAFEPPVVDDEAVTTAEPAPTDRWRSPSVGGALCAAAVVLLSAAPLLRGWWFVHSDTVLIMPDLNETWLSALAAGHLDQNVGAWSRIGLFHPGPMWFYWSAPFLGLAGGRPAGLFLAALALVAACAALTVDQVRRSLGNAAGLVAAATVAAALVLLDPTGLAFPWNPTVVILPVVAAIVCLAPSAAARSVSAASTGIVLSWFVIQAHLGALPLGAILLAASTVLAARAIGTEWRRRLGWVAACLLCLLLPVVPIVRDQVSGIGNAGAVARYVATGDVSPRFPDDPPSASQDLGVAAVLEESASITTMIQGDVARWAGADLILARDHEPSDFAPAVLLGLLVSAVAAASRLWRSAAERQDFIGWLGLLAVAGAGLQMVVAVRARGEFRPYLIASSAGVGVVLWLVAALQAWAAVAARAASIPTTGRWALKIGTCGALLLALWLFMRPPLEGLPPSLDSSNQASADIADAIGSLHVRVRVDGIGTLAPTQRLVAALERDGMAVTVDGREIAHFSDRQRHGDPSAVEIVLVPVDPDHAAPEQPLAVVDGFAVIRTG